MQLANISHGLWKLGLIFGNCFVESTVARGLSALRSFERFFSNQSFSAVLRPSIGRLRWFEASKIYRVIRSLLVNSLSYMMQHLTEEKLNSLKLFSGVVINLSADYSFSPV